MTRIIKIEAKGFKSFANKTELVFGEKFNCVIGPNGSGKSNVIDAVCFVLGKGSAKGLRAEKSANLIYNGGKSKTPAKEGEVSLFFDNTKRVFPLNEDVVKITRIVKLNGSSTYKINDVVHTRVELLEFLAKANVDPDGYNIILQGDIAHLIEMSGIERRQVIEEMAGIGIYEDKKQRALSELQKVEQGIQEGNIILTERATYLKELKQERDQAIKFKEVDAHLKQARRTLTVLSKNKKNAELDDLDKKGKERETQIAGHQEKIVLNKTKVVAHKERVSAINKEIEEKGEKEQVILHKQVEDLKVSLASDANRISTCDNEVERVTARITGLEASLTEMAAKIEESSRKESDTARLLEQKKALQDDLIAKIRALKEKFNLEGASVIEQRIEDIDKQADELQKEIAVLREKSQDDLREKDRLEIQISNMDEKIAKVAELEQTHAKELEILKQKKVEFKKATVELSQQLTDNTKIMSQLSAARIKLQKAAEELSRIDARQAAVAERQGGDMAVKKILENKKQFSGVRGTVGSLGVVEGQYSLALEVAAGNKLKGIVVEDDKTAASCIEYLREQRLGVASFFPMNKMRARKKDAEHDKLLSAKGVRGYAIDLIDFDPEYRNVMSFVFGNTIVVDSLDVARRIGIGTCKMVTLQGDLAEESGAMRGGFQKGRSEGSAFTEKQTQEQRIRADKDYHDAQIISQSMEKDKIDNEEKIVRLRELKASLEGDIIRIEKSLFINAEDVGVSVKLKTEFKEKLGVIDARVREANTIITGKTRTLTDLKVERQKLRAQVTDIRNPTKLAELNTFEERLQKVKEEIAGLSAQVSQISSQAKQMYAPEMENINRIIKQHRKEIETFTAEKKTLLASMSKRKEELALKEEKEKEFYKQFKSLIEERNSLQLAIEKAEEAIIALEEKIRDVERQNTSLSIEVARIKAEIAALEEEEKQYEGAQVFDETDIDKIKRWIWNDQQKLDAIGHVNMKALDTYEKVEQEYTMLLAKKQKLEEEKNTVMNIMAEIEVKKKELFLKIFDVLNDNFKKLFISLSAKGEAYLELENPDSPFDGGAYIKVRLTGKKFMDIRSLSGGEKAMTALAFIFAIQEYSPASFYIMDEVDAALDKKNAERLANLVKRYSDTAQFIVISHNDGVISSADQLYGVSMDEHNISQVVSLKL